MFAFFAPGCRKNIMKNLHLNKLLTQINEVPTLPTSVLRVLQMTEDPFCSSSDLAKVIQADPAMASKVLKLSNSSYYGFRQKISHIPQAVTLLGFATLKNTLLTASVFDMFGTSATGFDLPALWQHSITAATASKLVAKRVRYPHAEQAFTAALLHDMGKIIMARYIPQGMAEIVQLVNNEGMTMYEAEKKVIGLAHPALGAWVLARWGIPAVVVEAIEHHHVLKPDLPSYDLASIVSLSNYLAHFVNIGCGGDMLPREADPVVLEHFRLLEPAIVDMQEVLAFKRIEIESYAATVA